MKKIAASPYHSPRAQPAEFRHKAILINVGRSVETRDLYQANRFAWKISRKNALQAEVILPVVKGIIKGAFIADDWLPALAVNFPGRGDEPDRMGFVGREAPEEIKKLYMNRRVPDEYRQQGAANPIRYTWKI